MVSIVNDQNCPVGTTLKLIDGKWKILIIYSLLDSQTPAVRFSALRRSIQGITEKMLTAQLRDLEAAKLINRHVYAEVPPHVEYSLTPLGRSMRPILQAMQQWGTTYNRNDS